MNKIWKIIGLYSIVLMIMCAFSGCNTYKLTRTGVTDSYSGIKTVFKDVLVGAGKVLEGGSVTLGVETNAAYNDDEDKAKNIEE